MYLGIDVGGTKTLVAALDDNGVILEQFKFPTPQSYPDFLIQLKEALSNFNNNDFYAVGIGVPAVNINRAEGIAIAFSNLDWHNVTILKDVEAITNSPVALENDAKLAGLSEARLRQNVKRLLYVTISTGIGYSLIIDQKIDPNIGDSGGSLILLEHHGKLMPWENFASGKAIVKTFGKKAKDITDEDTWKTIARNISLGLVDLIAVTEPEVVVIGGSVGVYLDRFIKPLKSYIKSLETPLLKMPRIEAASRPEEAVVYGCYDYAKEVYGTNK